jgi:hypothetical protein
VPPDNPATSRSLHTEYIPEHQSQQKHTTTLHKGSKPGVISKLSSRNNGEELTSDDEGLVIQM